MADNFLNSLTGSYLGKRGQARGTGELLRGSHGAGSSPVKQTLIHAAQDQYYNPPNRPGARFGRGGIGVRRMMRSFGIGDDFQRNPTGIPGRSTRGLHVALAPDHHVAGSRMGRRGLAGIESRFGTMGPQWHVARPAQGSSQVIDTANLGAPSVRPAMRAQMAMRNVGATMHTANVRAFSGPGLLKRARNYVQAGGMMQSGMERMAGQHAAGQQFYRWGNSFYRTSASSGPMGPQLLGGASINAEGNLVGRGGKTLVTSPNGRPLSGKAATLFGRQMPWTAAGVAGSVGVAGTAYFAYLGYKGEISGNSGMSGVVDAGIIDLATMSGVAKFSSVATAVSAGVVSTGKVGFLRSLPMFIGAAVGASAGHGALGAPGAFAGGYVGAALGRAPLRLAAAGAVIGGSVAVGKGAYNLLKTGYRKRTASRGINTAGDMAAFYTQNAMTMRARAVGAIRNSHTNARSALGQEANFMHTNKNYFSPYRR